MMSKAVPVPVMWHDRHACLLGLDFQLSPCGVAGSLPVWHLAQLRVGCGKPTSEKLALPILYGRPSSANCLPEWMLCTIVDRVTTLPLLGSVVPGLWHITQYCVSTRLPPWMASLSWQVLQVAMSTILRACAGGDRRTCRRRRR